MGVLTLKIFISNDGCVEGQLSSTYIERFLSGHGLTLTKNLEDADLVIFYACGLTEQRQEQSLALIAQAKKSMKTSARLVVWGCLPKVNPEALRAVYNGPLIGPMDTDFFKNLVGDESSECDSMEIASPSSMLVSSETPGIQYGDAVTNTLLFFGQYWDRLWERARENRPFIIRVAKGCTGTCTYCSERVAFGRIRSRAVNNVLRDFEHGLDQGYNLFSLMATDLGAYGKDIGCALPDLLKEMIQTGKERDYKIILNQVNPFHLGNLYSDLREIFKSGRISSLCSPVQSGSDRILRLMQRQHTAEEWRGYMMLIGREFPRIRLVTQFMVGFPTETEEDFEATENLLNYPALFDYVHIFKFSRRPHVFAAYMEGQVPENVKEYRRTRLLRKYALTKSLNIVLKSAHGIF